MIQILKKKFFYKIFSSQACLPHLLKAKNPHILCLSPPLSMEPKWFGNHVGMHFLVAQMLLVDFLRFEFVFLWFYNSFKNLVMILNYSSQACLPHLLKAKNPHILNISPPLSMAAKWFQGHVGKYLKDD